MSDLRWKTGITRIEPNKILVRGFPVDRLMGKVSFTEAIYLILKGEKPSEQVARLLDAILVSSVDHGDSPSVPVALRPFGGEALPDE